MVRTGRPPIPEKLRKNKFLNLRMAEADMEVIRKASENAGQRINTWCHVTLVGQAVLSTHKQS